MKQAPGMRWLKAVLPLQSLFRCVANRSSKQFTEFCVRTCGSISVTIGINRRRNADLIGAGASGHIHRITARHSKFHQRRGFPLGNRDQGSNLSFRPQWLDWYAGRISSGIAAVAGSPAEAEKFVRCGEFTANLSRGRRPGAARTLRAPAHCGGSLRCSSGPIARASVPSSRLDLLRKPPARDSRGFSAAC